ncbi:MULTISPECIES: sugar transporter [unclassified Meridianimarinicoccus]|uniref:sugar transporter n=1 Tax=unclassified Meridianimarinicoccus TaxID=2923344 RepID=UPI0018671744|nr:sugar transporter [Fluviibacterium sp. MJW13]
MAAQPAQQQPAPQAQGADGPQGGQKPAAQKQPARPAQAQPGAGGGQKKPAAGPGAQGQAKPKPPAVQQNKPLVKQAPTPAKIPQQPQPTPQPRVPTARAKRRHWMLMFSFILFVVLPSALAFAYLYVQAADRFASHAAFSVHKEDSTSSFEMMSGLSALGVSSGTTPDADILYQFIQSQKMVEAVDAQVDLRNAFGRHYKADPVFSIAPDANLEDMVEYWERIVALVFDADIGLISMEVTAFTPTEAQRIAEIILQESSTLIQRLSKIARDDTIRLAQEELDIASARLKDVRLQMAEFRDIEQIVDPTADIAGQMGVISALQQSLAEAMIRRDLLIGTTRAGDPRIIQAEREIEAIRRRIEDERTKVGSREEESADDLARVVGDYESLVVDREFAEQSYIAALAAYDSAVAEARRKSRYLAVHIEPTLAETAIYPRRLTLGLLFSGFTFMVWMLVVLTLYSIRDRR